MWENDGHMTRPWPGTLPCDFNMPRDAQTGSMLIAHLTIPEDAEGGGLDGQVTWPWDGIQMFASCIVYTPTEAGMPTAHLTVAEEVEGGGHAGLQAFLEQVLGRLADVAVGFQEAGLSVVLRQALHAAP